MDMRSLSLFIHLADSLHFGKSAQANHVSPSTLSRSIQRIEEELGVSLFERDNRSVQLTDAGRQLQIFAREQVEQWQSLKLSFQQAQDHLEGTLKIYCSVTAAYSHLPDIIDKFRKKHPNIHIILTTGDAADGLEQVQKQSVDCAIAARPYKLASSLYFHSLAEIPLSIIAPMVDCSVKQQLAVANVNWQEVPLILPEHGPARRRIDRWFRQKLLGKPNIYAKVSGHEALVSMVALGCGVGIAPEVVIENSPVKDRIQRLTKEGQIAPFDLGLCCQKKHIESPIMHAFLSAISE